ncbi:MAG TPA: hypothetical protein P5567_04720 [Kiritimatiellia bacterium]|nr:hypothetical protein [Kiritimatiellia bacterium]HSA17451.1 hypothetical protein [Kiritimatiellia bacterium]
MTRRARGFLLGAGLALVLLDGAVRTPEVGGRLSPAVFINREMRRLDGERLRLETAYAGVPLTEAWRLRLAEDLAELERMRARLYAGSSDHP